MPNLKHISRAVKSSLCIRAVFHAMQAMDARRFVHDPNDAAARQQALFAAQANAALAQTPGHPVPLEEQVLPAERACAQLLANLIGSIWAGICCPTAPLQWHQGCQTEQGTEGTRTPPSRD